jgi:hypothetical protein
MPRPILPEGKGILVAGYVSSAATPQQRRAADTIMGATRQFPRWLDVIDTRACGSDPDALVPHLTGQRGACVGIPVADDASLDWATRVSRSLKQADPSARTLLIKPGLARDVAPVLASRPTFDVALPVSPILMEALPSGDTDPLLHEWMLAGANLFDTWMRILARDPLDGIPGVAYRTDDGTVRSRECYEPELFGDEYYEAVADPGAVDAIDLAAAAECRASLVYGELATSAVVKLLSGRYCDAAQATTLYELGMGTGRLALQAFLTCPTLSTVVGVELSGERYRIAARAAAKAAARHGFTCTEEPARIEVVDERSADPRRLVFVHGDLFDVPIDALRQAQIVLLLTHVPGHEARVDAMVNALPPGTRLATGHDLAARPGVRVQPIPAGRPWHDGFATSFSPNYYYYVFRRVGGTT